MLGPHVVTAGLWQVERGRLARQVPEPAAHEAARPRHVIGVVVAGAEAVKSGRSREVWTPVRARQEGGAAGRVLLSKGKGGRKGGVWRQGIWLAGPTSQSLRGPGRRSRPARSARRPATRRCWRRWCSRAACARCGRSGSRCLRGEAGGKVGRERMGRLPIGRDEWGGEGVQHTGIVGCNVSSSGVSSAPRAAASPRFKFLASSHGEGSRSCHGHTAHT
jgi:hypothetical protein